MVTSTQRPHKRLASRPQMRRFLRVRMDQLRHQIAQLQEELELLTGPYHYEI